MRDAERDEQRTPPTTGSEAPAGSEEIAVEDLTPADKEAEQVEGGQNPGVKDPGVTYHAAS